MAVVESVEMEVTPEFGVPLGGLVGGCGGGGGCWGGRGGGEGDVRDVGWGGGVWGRGGEVDEGWGLGWHGGGRERGREILRVVGCGVEGVVVFLAGSGCGGSMICSIDQVSLRLGLSKLLAGVVRWCAEEGREKC